MLNQSTKPEKFTIRVYGIMIDAVKGVLVADEIQNGLRLTKFPGGGLEHGEGTRDCLAREWMEELHQRIQVTSHLYTTDFYQPSAFDPRQQVISIYYRVEGLDSPAVSIADSPFNFIEEKDGAQCFRWIAPEEFHPQILTLPIDQVTGQIILPLLNPDLSVEKSRLSAT